MAGYGVISVLKNKKIVYINNSCYDESYTFAV